MGLSCVMRSCVCLYKMEYRCYILGKKVTICNSPQKLLVFTKAARNVRQSLHMVVEAVKLYELLVYEE